RHTSSKRDWSSDVCSSDLVLDGLVVDVHDAAGDTVGDLHATHRIGGDDPQRQPVLGGVGQLHQLLDGGETHHRGDGAEDLLCVCGCVCIDTVQDSGPVEQVLVGTTGTQADTVLDATLYPYWVLVVLYSA